MSTVDRKIRTARVAAIIDNVVMGLFMTGVVLVLGGGLVFLVTLDAPTIDPADHPFDYPWRSKTILNAGGLGLLYWEGAECLVHLYGTFEPLGTYKGQQVGRYIPRETSQLSWRQCPRGTLITLTWEESAAWQEYITHRRDRETAQEAERQLTLQSLTKRAAQP